MKMIHDQLFDAIFSHFSNLGNDINTVFTLNSNTYSSSWIYKTVDISTTKDFRIILSVTTKSPSTYIGVDNIKYKSGTCSGTALTTLPPMPTTVIPLSTLSCDFEQITLCNWVNNPKSTVYNRWKVYHYNLVPRTALMPEHDHTKNNIFGSYAYILNKASDSLLAVNAEMTVTNNAVTPGYVSPFCFSLWFYMKSNGYVKLNVSVIAPDNRLVNTFIRENGQGDQWNQMQFEAPGDKNGYRYSIYAFARQGKFFLTE